MTRTIDAHHHFWQAATDKQPWMGERDGVLNADFGPDDLVPEIARAGVDATILIQSVNENAENDRLSRYATSNLVAGVVAWLPISDPKSALQELGRMSRFKVCGVRSLIGKDPLEWLPTASVISLFKTIARQGLAWDVVPVTAPQMAAVHKIALAVPELKIIVDHLGRPPMNTGGWEPWASNISELAARPNVAVKISIGIDVLSRLSGWQALDLLPYVRWVGRRFGASRLMLASNWPVVLLRADYQQVWSDLTSIVRMTFTSDHDRKRLLGETADEWYSLAMPTTPPATKFTSKGGS